MDKFRNGNALLIGVGADLPITIKDATAIYELLVDPLRCAYDPKQVELLIGEKSTRTGILGAFDRLTQQVNTNSHSTTIVYFSGHGGRFIGAEDTKNYFLVPFGFDRARLEETTISGAEFTSKIEMLKGQKLVVILDCCHAGGMPMLKTSDTVFAKEPIPPELLDTLGSGTGTVVIASSHENEYSYMGKEHSIFTGCLLDALSGKASFFQDGYVRILDILVYLFREVPKRGSGPQHPFLKKVLDLGDNFPVCYHVGGSKDPLHQTTIGSIVVNQNLLPSQRRHLEQRLKMLEPHYELLSEKILRLRSALPLETDIATKFKLEKQIEQSENEYRVLLKEIQSLEEEKDAK
ncbi:MAG: hypothetical protein BroJett039_06550 [Chloroflexota bacterium]|nr:MAG: hypothetical protein BroJett039_06550 [Chloroflexota bacterium]